MLSRILDLSHRRLHRGGKNLTATSREVPWVVGDARRWLESRQALVCPVGRVLAKNEFRPADVSIHFRKNNLLSIGS